MSSKFWRYLYSNKNIAGSLLGIAGMLLFFIGIIDKYWPFIVIGLYGVGYFAVPQDQKWDLKLNNTLQGQQLKSALDKMVAKVIGKLNPDLVSLLTQLNENLDHLIDTTTKIQVSNQLNHFIQQTVTDYLPYAIERYLNLPPMYRKVHAIKGNETPHNIFKKQLTLLNDETKKLIDQLHQDDVQALKSHARFLEDKFKEVDLLR